MSSPGESYEEWLARTAPTQPVRTVDPRTWDWGVIALLTVFFVWLGGSGRGWVGLSLPVALGVGMLLAERIGGADAARVQLLRGSTLLVSLVLSGWIIAEEGAVAVVLPVILVLLDLKDDRSFLRWAFERRRARRG